MLVLQIDDIKEIIRQMGFKTFFLRLIDVIETDYKNWDDFKKIPRVATHLKDGVIELMPISNKQLYTFKYVNGHPKNPKENKSTVMATGQLSQTKTGEPLLFCEMTLLTALRTAATSALAAKYLAKKDSKVLGFVGTGAQSEFQFHAFSVLFDIEELRYFDIDKKAMKKLEKNLEFFNIKLTACKNAREVVKNSDIITTMTADKNFQTIITEDMLHKDVYINAIGGDCPGKTELDINIVKNNHVIVEFLKQSKIEGEIQNLSSDFTCPELHEVLNESIKLNVSKDGTIVFDSVGFALQDYSVLRLVYELARELGLGSELNLVPKLKDVKDLYSLL